MMERIGCEAKIAGMNPVWISALWVAAFSAVCALGGDLVHWGYLGYEVVYPFFITIAVGEWGKFRTDALFGLIAVEAKSLFGWIAMRFAYLFCLTGAFGMAGMGAVCLIRGEAPYMELLFAGGATAVFFASLCALLSLLSKIEHLSTGICGMVWLFFLLAVKMLETAPGSQYFYPFLRYAGPHLSMWPVNKCILLGFSAFIWLGIYGICKTRRGIQD